MATTHPFVQFGCGLSAPEQWTNFDASPTLRLQLVPIVGVFFRGPQWPPFPAAVRYGNIVQGLPVEVETVRGMYSSHVLEHLALDDLRTALRNCFSYLRPGGSFRSVLPDLRPMVEEYVQSSATHAAHDLMRNTMLGRTSRPRSLSEILRNWLGNSAHMWMWDYKALEVELREAGFGKIRRAAFGDASEPAFRYVEDAARWSGALGIECVKP